MRDYLNAVRCDMLGGDEHENVDEENGMCFFYCDDCGLRRHIVDEDIHDRSSPKLSEPAEFSM